MKEQESTAERMRLSLAADAFYAARLRGAVTDWRPYLEAVPTEKRLELLIELISIDLEHRWRQGEQAYLEEYLHRFPELGTADTAYDELIVEEYRCRLHVGQAPHWEELAQRFPTALARLRPELEKLAAGASASQGYATPPAVLTAAQEQEPEPTDSSASQYEMVRLLGRGCSGEVWLARKRSSGINKAVKILTWNAESSAAFRRERRALELIKNIRHPYLLATEDFWVAHQRLYIVMELAEGTLRQRLHSCRQMGLLGIPLRELLGYMREAAEGLDFLHQQQIVHRDVKPDNILLLHGHAKVADFGLIWRADRSLTTMRTFAGTPVYMAPEVWSRQGGPASDQYALAVSYIEMRQGIPPLAPGSLEELLVAHRTGRYRFESLIGPAEQEVLLRALSREPHERFPSCSAFVSTLAEALALSLNSTPLSQEGARTCTSSIAVATSSVSTPSSSPSALAGDPAGAPSVPKWLPSASTVETAVAVVSEGRADRLWRSFIKLGVVAAILSAVAGILWHMSWRLTRESPHSRSRSEETPAYDQGSQRTEQPLRGELLLPHPLAQPEPGSKTITLADGRRVADWIVIPVGSQQVRFHLIAPASGPPAPSPFYMQQTKVWNQLYAAGGGEVPAESAAHGASAPVTYVTAVEAARFASVAFGGRLPTPSEWDYAAGLHLVQDRPFVSRPGSNVWVNQPRPRSAIGDVASGDVNEFGLVDMAGNGREWTCALLPVDPQMPPILWDLAHPPGNNDAVILRGRNFTLSTPLTFEQLRREQTMPQRQYAGSRSPYTSFRVVLPLPPKD